MKYVYIWAYYFIELFHVLGLYEQLLQTDVLPLQLRGNIYI